MKKLLDAAKELPNRLTMPVMWPETFTHLMSMDRRHQWDPETLAEESLLVRERAFADPERLMELLHTSESGLIQLATLAKQWERRQANAVRLLRQQLDTLNMQRIEAERKHRQILEEQWSPRLNNSTYTIKREDGAESTSPMEEDEMSSSGGSGSRGSLVGSVSGSFGDEHDGSVEYWKERAKTLDHLLAESLQREQVLLSRLHENLVEPTVSLPLEELQDHLQRLDNFLHFTLRKAPVVVGHQDKELRYRFVYNAFPSLAEEEVMGKTDAEIYSGLGVDEVMEFKREVLQRGWPLKREINFDTDLFGPKTFLIAAEPVFSKTGDILGLNYVAMDVTDEAAKREKIICLREDIAVQKAMESELHKTIDITEETMRAKQMLATMSHEIRSPLSGVVSMAEVLATTKLDTEQRQLVDVMMSSGDLVLQLINDILDLSKVESAMKLEAKKFRPREVVKHVLQMTLASVQHKHLVLEGDVADEVPVEVIGDVLRIRQVFTNLVSNAIKFTHKGVVAIKMRLESSPDTPASNRAFAKFQTNKACKPVINVGPSSSPDSSSLAQSINNQQASPPRPHAQNTSEANNQLDPKDGSDSSQISRSTSTASSVSTLSSASSTLSSLSSASSFSAKALDEVSSVEPGEATPPSTMWESPKSYEKSAEVIWLHCEVCDTGIGIPEAALPSLFEKYTQVSTTHARKYGGTGLGLAICKQLVGLMGGTLKVASKENEGSTFSFTLPLRAVKEKPSQVQLNDKVYRMISDSQEKTEISSKKRGYFQFTPNVIPSTVGSTRPLLHSPSADGKGKNGKAMDVSKLRQMYGESFAQNSQPGGLGDHSQTGETNSTADKALPKEENRLPLSSRDVTGSSSSQSCCDGPSDLIHKRGCAATSDTSCQPPPSLKSNTPKNNAGGSKASIPPLPPARILNSSPNADQRPQRLPRILLAEDNKVNVMVAQSMLKRLGHSLEVVSNGAEAVHAVQKSNYDLILMDVSMPVMDGLEATRLIRRFEDTGQWLYSEEQGESERSGSSSSSTDNSVVSQKSETAGMLIASPRQRTPIIAMTANALADNVVECYNHGMDCFIAKPVTFQKLEQVLKQFIPWLDHERGRSLLSS
ncbi:hypothetical protein Mapa_004806 [Marchantia paleacea]|nr:hypothetical protein Mapa_004806 [Marchantia paleacea]